MVNLLREATATFNEVLRMHSLYEELVETLSVTLRGVMDYAEKNNIPLHNRETLTSLINKAESLIHEIASETAFPEIQKISDDSLHDRHNRRRLYRTVISKG